MINIKKDYICGPRLKTPIPDCSFAEYFVPRLKSHPKGNVIQVDAATGFAESSMEFLARGLKMCEGLKMLGLGQKDVICIMARNSRDVYTAVLGILIRGGIAAPVSAEFKIMELKHAFGNIFKPAAVICEETLVPLVTAALETAGVNSKIIVLAEIEKVKKPYIAFEELLKAEVDVGGYIPEPIDSPSTTVSVIISTSGSTGLPKGVGITHRNLIFQTLCLREDVANSVDSCLVTSHFYWISCLHSFLRSLDMGTKIIYITDITMTNILMSIQKYKPEWIFMSASFFTKMAKGTKAGKYDFSSLKRVVLGGCPITEAALVGAKTLGISERNVVNYYGATEVTGPISCTHEGKNLMSVGRIFIDVQMKIIDTITGKTLGPNQLGEVVSRSEGMMKEYVGNEKATKETISDGWYHTGDLGYYDEEENLYIIDRLKEMIKSENGQVVFSLQNQQISPGEVENAIEMVPGVKDAGVVGFPSETGECFLVALAVKRDLCVTQDDVKDFLRDKLADFKIPKLVKFVEEIPRSPVGKMKRKELKDLATSLFFGN